MLVLSDYINRFFISNCSQVPKRLDYRWQNYYEICRIRAFEEGDIETVRQS